MRLAHGVTETITSRGKTHQIYRPHGYHDGVSEGRIRESIHESGRLRC